MDLSNRRRLLATVAITTMLAAGGGIAFAATSDERGLGPESASDWGAATVVATPVPPDTRSGVAGRPNEAAGANAAEATAGRSLLASALFRRPRRAGDDLPKAFAEVADLPILKRGLTRRVDSGAGPMWIVAAENGAVALVGDDHVTGTAASALAEGKLLRIYETVPGDASAVVVSGFLPDDARDVSISTRAGTRVLGLRDNFYSARFGKSIGELPRTLNWVDDRGRHGLDIPLSPDLQ